MTTLVLLIGLATSESLSHEPFVTPKAPSYKQILLSLVGTSELRMALSNNCRYLGFYQFGEPGDVYAWDGSENYSPSATSSVRNHFANYPGEFVKVTGSTKMKKVFTPRQVEERKFVLGKILGIGGEYYTKLVKTTNMEISADSRFMTFLADDVSARMNNDSTFAQYKSIVSMENRYVIVGAWELSNVRIRILLGRDSQGLASAELRTGAISLGATVSTDSKGNSEMVLEVGGTITPMVRFARYDSMWIYSLRSGPDTEYKGKFREATAPEQSRYEPLDSKPKFGGE